MAVLLSAIQCGIRCNNSSKMAMAFSSSPSSSRVLALPYWAVAESAYSTYVFSSESQNFSFASGANVLCGSFSVAAIRASRLIISLLGVGCDAQPAIKQMAGHKNTASPVLEKAMVMEEYIMTRYEYCFHNKL